MLDSLLAFKTANVRLANQYAFGHVAPTIYTNLGYTGNKVRLRNRKVYRSHRTRQGAYHPAPLPAASAYQLDPIRLVTGGHLRLYHLPCRSYRTS